MKAYYNEHDPFASAWLHELIKDDQVSDGKVDERSIKSVQPSDLEGFSRAHFFAGIGGWDYALRLAGWPEGSPVWTGSCPCQPFSVAGQGKGEDDERHLWPEWFRLIRECRPDTIFGEQVANAIGHGWLDLVFGDLEGEGYSCGAVVLGAHSVGAPHIRQRVWWVAHAKSSNGRPEYQSDGDSHRGDGLGRRSPYSMDNAASPRRDGAGQRTEREAREQRQQPANSGAHFWSNAVWLPCSDGKERPVEPVPESVSAGLPGGLGLVRYEGREIFHPLIQDAKNRVGRLRGYGNSIVPQAAAEFIRAFMEAQCSTDRT